MNKGMKNWSPLIIFLIGLIYSCYAPEPFALPALLTSCVIMFAWSVAMDRKKKP